LACQDASQHDRTRRRRFKRRASRWRGAAAFGTIRTSEQRRRPMPVSGLGPYDEQNIFARILRGEIPSKTVFEDEWALAFHDIAPQAPLHVLVIPKGRYVSLADFTAHAGDAEIAGFFRAVGAVARLLELETPGYRILANMGQHAGQEVPHFHVHVFGGRPLGRMLER
jgi:diadenosine tetraphosphate (Ap4A) HIT family hydrolase